MEGNLFFKIDRASLIVGSKFTVFALFSFLFEGNFPSRQASRGASVWRGDLTGGFLSYRFGAGAHNPGLGGLYLEGLIHGGVYFRNFTVVQFSIFQENPADRRFTKRERFCG